MSTSDLEGRAAKGSRTALIICGIAGCGKTTFSKYLAKAWSKPALKIIEGDDHHPLANKVKMKNLIPLTDSDREPWLKTLSQEAARTLNESSGDHAGVVVACSALKSVYRDWIRRDITADCPGATVQFVMLNLGESEATQRLKERVGHYMKGGMVKSQLNTRELPKAEEKGISVINSAQDRRNVLASLIDIAAPLLGLEVDNSAELADRVINGPLFAGPKSDHVPVEDELAIGVVALTPISTS